MATKTAKQLRAEADRIVGEFWPSGIKRLTDITQSNMRVSMEEAQKALLRFHRPRMNAESQRRMDMTLAHLKGETESWCHVPKAVKL
jgi:S-methylmethionine-dependent homocysteine/selenocysteine methylase